MRWVPISLLSLVAAGVCMTATAATSSSVVPLPTSNVPLSQGGRATPLRAGGVPHGAIDLVTSCSSSPSTFPTTNSRRFWPRRTPFCSRSGFLDRSPWTQRRRERQRRTSRDRARRQRAAARTRPPDRPGRGVEGRAPAAARRRLGSFKRASLGAWSKPSLGEMVRALCDSRKLRH
jgi:hypothetical protein